MIHPSLFLRRAILAACGGAAAWWRPERHCECKQISETVIPGRCQRVRPKAGTMTGSISNLD
jgi:hypothetical protein